MGPAFVPLYSLERISRYLFRNACAPRAQSGAERAPSERWFSPGRQRTATAKEEHFLRWGDADVRLLPATRRMGGGSYAAQDVDLRRGLPWL